MDVITFLHVEGESPHPRTRISQRQYASPDTAAVAVSRPSFAALREMPVIASFPVLFVLLVSLSVSLTPLLQDKLGFYRLDQLSLPDDARLDSAMQTYAIPEPDASLLANADAQDLPLSIRAVSWSSYKVRSGDTLAGIAARFGLHNISSILSANSISNVRRVTMGQNLRIPSMDGITYTVSRGDSLGRICSRYSIPVNAILDANDIADATLSVGDKLFIPGATLSAADLRRALGEFFMFPVQGYRITSRFGYRSDPFTGVRTFHTGIDLAAPYGTPIKASLAGTVAATGFSAVFGNYVILSHDDGFQTLYGHMSSIGASRGDRVSQGTVIGYVGSTGYSTGCHVHLSVYKKGKMIDPLSVLK